MKNKIAFRILSCITASVFLGILAAGCASDSDNANGPATPETYELQAATDAQGNKIMLASGAKSDYKIVLPTDADAYETFAVQELQLFLTMSTGATLPVITDEGISYDNTQSYISVGNTSLNNLSLTRDEYGASGGIVDVDGNLVILAGAEGYGTINAVYQFMHYEIGWEVYATDEVYYETKEEVELLNFQDHKYIPITDYRYAWYKNLFGPSNQTAATRMGFVMGSWRGGSSFDGFLFADFLHNLKTLVPTSDPTVGSDWFQGGNLCLSRPEIEDYVTEVVKKLLLTNPKSEYLMLGNGDNAGACNCDSCKEALKTCGTQGGISIRFLNHIVENLEEERFFEQNPQVNPDVEFMFLNYQAYVEAPVDAAGNVLVEAKEHVGAFVCLIAACQGHALDDPDCPINASQLNIIQNWSKITDTIGSYLYWCNYKDYFTYYNNWAAIQTWARTFEELDVKYYYAQCVDNDYSPLGGLRQYLMSKYLATPDCGDFETLTRDFIEHYYKGAETEMYDYYQAIRQHTTAMQHAAGSSCVNCYDNGDIKYTDGKWWSVPTIERLLAMLDKAYDALDQSEYPAEKKEEYRKRILIEETTLRFYRYRFHAATYTDAELLEEKAFLRNAFETLGCARSDEYGDLVI